MAGIIQTPGLSGGRQGVMKEKIVDVEILTARIDRTDDEESGIFWATQLTNDINEEIKEGYQIMPGSYTVQDNYASVVMIKTEMNVEMI